MNSEKHISHLAEGEERIDPVVVLIWFWKRKFRVILVSVIFGAIGLFYSLRIPNIYEGETLLSSGKSGSGSIGRIPSRYLRLAAMAGVDQTPGSIDPTILGMTKIMSRQYVLGFIERHKLLPKLIAPKKWDPVEKKLYLDEEIYDSENGEWRTNAKGESLCPTPEGIHNAFKNTFKIEQDELTRIISLTVRHVSPKIAMNWANLIVYDYNNWERKRALEKGEKNLAYLKQQLEKTNLAELKTIFNQLIEEQIKNSMFTEVEEEYGFQVVDPAALPEKKVGPKRAVYVLGFFFAGLILTVLASCFPMFVKMLKQQKGI